MTSPPIDIREIASLEAGGYPVPLYFCGPGTSSLDVAWSLAEADRLPVWGAVLLESQTAGRGRMGRVWQSPAGHIYGALRLPTAPPFDGPGASLVLALYLAEALKDFGWAVNLKWPNDLIYEGGKTGGLLLESKKDRLVAGIGLNLNAPPPGDWPASRDPGAPGPSALPFSGGPAELWTALVKRIILLYNEEFQGRSLADLIPKAEAILHWRGRTVTVVQPASVPPAPESGLVGRLEGLGPEGYLRLVNARGEYQLWSGTVCLAD